MSDFEVLAQRVKTGRQLRPNGFELKRKQIRSSKQQRLGVTYTVIKIFQEDAQCAVAQDWHQEEGEKIGMARHDANEAEVNEGYPPLQSIGEERLSFRVLR